MSRVYNFSAGPAVMPEEVLREAAAEMLEYKNSGQSVMEMSHRSKDFQDIIDEAEKDLRDLMNIPDNFRLFNLWCPWIEKPCLSIMSITYFKHRWFLNSINLKAIWVTRSKSITCNLIVK